MPVSRRLGVPSPPKVDGDRKLPTFVHSPVPRASLQSFLHSTFSMVLGGVASMNPLCPFIDADQRHPIGSRAIGAWRVLGHRPRSLFPTSFAQVLDFRGTVSTLTVWELRNHPRFTSPAPPALAFVLSGLSSPVDAHQLRASGISTRLVIALPSSPHLVVMGDGQHAER